MKFQLEDLHKEAIRLFMQKLICRFLNKNFHQLISEKFQRFTHSLKKICLKQEKCSYSRRLEIIKAHQQQTRPRIKQSEREPFVLDVDQRKE